MTGPEAAVQIAEMYKGHLGWLVAGIFIYLLGRLK
jgi:hypothetical protein